ncbi:suppressor of fused-like protein [Dinothrombium tinctorium]|uniref:Suppressor of fused-like protein n=1 Tax=Dinothrombium tinctorium TaxID=1965070 RepID=A0A443QL11_9ACAR|nr:suppressor of fused-like protein [Dinothrombium tinctorium]
MGFPLNAGCMSTQNPIPVGLHALYNICRNVYPSQPNPLQVTAVVKYWLGGPDPLDYISMYANAGDAKLNIPPHWHYISFGLSDLHGDGRVHEISGPETQSGFGFELTFRLKRESGETSPPTWPAAVMQALAKYVFQSENVLCPGDHVSWHCSLDNSESRIQHMLMTEDPQLGTAMTPFGSVTFIQIVGVCAEELKAAQQWNGPSIIDLMKSVPGAGGPWLVTDMRRGETIFEIDPEIQEAVDDGIATEGSNLSGVSARCSWSEHNPFNSENISSESDNNEKKAIDGKSNKSKNLVRNKSDSSRNSRNSSMSVSHDHNQSNSPMSYTSETGAPEPGELLQPRFLNSIHLQLNLEAGLLLPLALRGRLKHGRHFTFKNVIGDLAITFVTPSVSGSHVTREHPYAITGPWLQILIPDEFIDEIYAELQDLSEVQLPHTYNWPSKNISLTIVAEEA